MYPTRPATFTYHRPSSVEEAVSLLEELDDSRLLAGGHSLLPAMKLRISMPAALVDIGRIPGLGAIEPDGDGLRIGALATHAEVASSEAVQSVCPILGEAASLIGDRQVRNRGTIGGSLAHADPGADYPTVVTALGATIAVTGPRGTREIPADGFFTGIFTTALAPGELITSVRVPMTAGTGAAYIKHKHPASGYAVAAVAALVTVEGGSCNGAKVVVGGVTGLPAEAAVAAQSLLESRGSAEDISAAAAKVPEALGDAFGDGYASAEYRTHLASVLAGRALTAAFARAAG